MGAQGAPGRASHRLAARAVGNYRLARLIDATNLLVRVLRQLAGTELGASASCARSHVAVAGALLDGVAPEAASLMATHVREVGDAMLGPVAELGRPEPARRPGLGGRRAG